MLVVVCALPVAADPGERISTLAERRTTIANQQTVHGNNQFVGSDAIPHTPKGESIRLLLGNSFDVTAHKSQTDYQVVSDAPSIAESSYRIVLNNAKDSAATVLVVEPIPGDWTITSESAPHLKSSSSTATWTLSVPPNGSTTLTYTARVRF
jgi:hypothetical protein